MNQLLQYFLHKKNEFFTASTLADFSCKIGKKQIWAWPHTLWMGQGVQNIAGAQSTPHRPCGGPIGGLTDPESLIFCCGQSAICGLKKWENIGCGWPKHCGWWRGLLGVPSSNLVCHMPWGASKVKVLRWFNHPKRFCLYHTRAVERLLTGQPPFMPHEYVVGIVAPMFIMPLLSVIPSTNTQTAARAPLANNAPHPNPKDLI